MPNTQGFPNTQIQGFPNMPNAQGFPNVQGFPNAPNTGSIPGFSTQVIG
jgi:hypothetical protein